MPGLEIMARVMMGLLLGFLFGRAHLFLLRQALESSHELRGDEARQRILKGMPLRVLLWAPAAIVAVYGGLPTSVGLLIGMVASRWLCWHRLMEPR